MRKYIIPGVLSIALVATAVWGYYQYGERNDYHTYLDIQFQRQFYDMIGHVENLQVDLAKAMVSGSNPETIKHLNSTVQQAYLAQEKMTQLPFYHGAIRRTEEFLSQLGDYTTAMVNKSLEGQHLEPDEMQTLEELHQYANYLSQQLIELQQTVAAGGIKFGDLRREGNRDLGSVSDQMKDFNLIDIEERINEYPELIYDGPFSEHLKRVAPKLEGETISAQQAIDIANENFADQNFDEVVFFQEINNTSIKGYYLRATKNGADEGQEVSMAISQVGGHVVWYLDPRETGESQLDRPEAIEIAEEFLEKLGYENMVSTYLMAYEGQTIINFAYEQDDVIVYTDLIKVKVALDNGEIIGFETEGYLINHHERDIPEPKLTEEEAQEKLSSAVEVDNVRLALIPVAGNHEILTYEFKVQFGEDRYLIYIDAESGEQRQILLMIEEEDGTLVI
ncbi:Spore germination YpeB [Alkaliphilus metalliredigens QYMF]|uniref:Spore germination YpeB n=1 Tax=Alkaliphilus metalliredigens (strain QYMF) TaxID=293826 RepID=A6TN00_ALKMQ|nr:germination protein YpeB [Alkaliphilus metalliredigens]ABR47568.1 Spore germination YpeB [Alkaliphilus metalliredigens QYMF]